MVIFDFKNLIYKRKFNGFYMLFENIYDSVYAKEFHTFDLNGGKSDMLYEKAEIIRDFKNHISGIISTNPLKYLNYSKFDLNNDFNNSEYNNINFDDKLVSIDRIQSLSDVYDCYLNKMKQVNLKFNPKIQDKIIINFYSKNGKNYKKGDLKLFEVKLKETNLTKTIKFLINYGDIPNLIGYIENVLKTEKDEKRLNFYKNIYHYINKFGLNRLLILANSIRNRVLKRYFSKQIIFKAPTYRTGSRLEANILDYNKNKDSIFNAFITIGGYVDFDENGKKCYNKIDIPIVYSKDYHGDMNEFSDYYTIVFNEKKKTVKKIVLSKKGERNVVVDDLNETNFLGLDVNVKHNLFSLSDKHEIDYDRELLDDYVKFLKKIDKAKQQKQKLGLSKEDAGKLSNKNQETLDMFIDKIEIMYENKILELIRYMKCNNYNHLVIEDLSSFGSGYSRSEDYLGFKYSRLVKLLNLTTIKDIIKRLCYKHNIAVSMVPSHYTSQKCNKCGYIDKGNRQTQENFKCLSCGYEENADTNSSENIENIMSLDVLRTKLLYKNNFGEYLPKKLSKYKIKDILCAVQTPLPGDIVKENS